MPVYGCIFCATALLFAVLAARIYAGRTELIHDYHQEKVRDKQAYGRAFGKALAVTPLAMVLSAAAAFLGEAFLSIAVAVLFLGLGVSIAAIVRVQKKYNGGVF